MPTIDPNKKYFPLSGRLKIPATRTPDNPYQLILASQARNLEYIEIHLPQAGVLQDLGVRIYSNHGALYPAMGSKADNNFTSAKDTYGAMPTSGLPLILPFNHRLLGPPYNITFEFYNDGAGTVSVNLFVIVSEQKIMVTKETGEELSKNAV